MAKGSADLKVSNSLLEVQLEQSRDEVELALKKKASVEVCNDCAVECLFQCDVWYAFLCGEMCRKISYKQMS